MHYAFMANAHERLKWAREQADYEDATAAAESLGIPAATYLGHENGSRGFKSRAEAYARKFRVSLEWLLTGRGNPKAGVPPKARAVGYVGAGAEIIPVDDHALGAGFEEVDLPPGTPIDAVLVIVRGDSMYPRYFDGEFLLYQRDQTPPDELVGQECVVRLRDGRTFVKRLRRGSAKNKFNLESWNGPLIENQDVEWAARVLSRVNRHLAA